MPHCNPFLAISEQKRCGLILCSAYHAEFAGPGAAIVSPVDQGYEIAIAIGSPEIVTLNTAQQRQQAYSRRIQWIRWLERIAQYPDPMTRAEKLLSSFEAFFSHDVVAELPDELLALLIGVFPTTVQTVRSQRCDPTQNNPIEKKALEWQWLNQQAAKTTPSSLPKIEAAYAKTLSALGTHFNIYTVGGPLHRFPCPA